MKVRRMLRRAAMAAVLTLACAHPARAQGEAVVSGVVRAVLDGSAVPGAAVVLRPEARGEQREAACDESGRFAFPLVPPGAYRLTVSAEGFTGRTLALRVEPRETRTLAIALDLQPLVAAVDVVGIAAPASTHSPSSTMLGAEWLERLPAGQQQSLPDAIAAAAPGMIRGHDDFVHVRGHEIALNTTINGVSFWENPHALFSPGLSPTIIDTVNVMTGGFPAEYGNRFGGVLDIVTKSGLRMQNEGALTVSAGGAGRRHGTGEIGGHRGRFGYFAFGSVLSSDRFISPPHPRAIHDTGRRAHLFFQADAAFERAGALRAVIMGDATSFEIPKHPRDLELRPQASAVQRARQQSAILGWTRAGDDLLLGASGYQRWSRTRLLPASGPLTAVAGLDRRLLTAGGKVDATRLLGRQSIKAGLDVVTLRPSERLSYDYDGYRALTHALGWPHIHVAGGAITFDGAEAGGQLSAYVQDTIQLGRRATLNAGVRLDHYSVMVQATHVSPRVNVAFDAGRGATVHASYNRFFVPPPVEGVLFNSAGLTARIREIGAALPPLEPSTEDQIELGASRSAGPLRLALTGYYRATDNPIHTTVWPDSRIYSYASFDRERAYGLETKLELPPTGGAGLSGYVNYALGRVTFYNPVTGGFVTGAAHLRDSSGFLAPMDQTHTLTAGATYRHARTGAWAALLLEYGSGTPRGHGAGHDHGAGDEPHADGAGGDEGPRVPSHVTAGLSTGLDLLRDSRRRGRLALQLDVENITNDVYLIAQEGEFSPAQYSIPRLVSVTLTYRF